MFRDEPAHAPLRTPTQTAQDAGACNSVPLVVEYGFVGQADGEFAKRLAGKGVCLSPWPFVRLEQDKDAQ